MHEENVGTANVMFSFQPETVRLNILSHLTSLTHLDGALVEEEEAAEAAQMAINQVKYCFLMLLK